MSRAQTVRTSVSTLHQITSAHAPGLNSTTQLNTKANNYCHITSADTFLCNSVFHTSVIHMTRITGSSALHAYL